MNEIKEQWKKIEDFEYMVSNTGKVIGLKRNTELSPFLDKDGYQCVNLSNGRARKKVFVHRLVAIYFIQNTEEKAEVNHKDGIKTNNNVENLEWATRSENQQHAYDIGLQVVPKGEDHWLYKPENHLKDEEKKKIINVDDKYYETVSTTRCNFIARCEKYGWNKYAFEEIPSGETDNHGRKKFFYKKIGEDTINLSSIVTIKVPLDKSSDDYYSENSITRGDFKKRCARKGQLFEDYSEIESNEKQGNTKKFFYVKK